MKILLLEDNQTLNNIISERLISKGYKVYSYICGKDAYDNITNGFSCFIIDIHVPNVDGIKILNEVKKYYKDVPVIIISSTVELNIIKEAYDIGCHDYMKKPFFIDELEIKVDRLCNIPKEEIDLGDNHFYNFKERTLKVNNVEKELTEKENLLLNLFLININNLVTYENIQNYVWKGEHASIDSIRTLIKVGLARLRRKIPTIYIKAASNSGYRFSFY